jgi:hypothetical protein
MCFILRYIEVGTYCAVVSLVHKPEISMIPEAEERLKLKALLHCLKTPNCDLNYVRTRAETF